MRRGAKGARGARTDRSIALFLAFVICAFTATAAAGADLLLAINKVDQTLAIVDAATLKVPGPDGLAWVSGNR